jgi:hypothetical protein
VTFALRVSRDGIEAFGAEISELYAKSIALLGLAIRLQLSRRPADGPVLIGRLMMTIEDALQGCLTLHSDWLAMCLDPTIECLQVEVLGLSGEIAGHQVTPVGVGGPGGRAAWPGGGGGGGGAGQEEGGHGGDGGAGAVVLFQYSQDYRAIDVEVLVSPGSFEWVCQKDVKYVEPILIGGGGGGGAGAAQFTI